LEKFEAFSPKTALYLYMTNFHQKKAGRIDLGRTNYKETWQLQKKLVDLRYQKKIADSILCTEHEPVITMGRGATRGNLLVPSVELKKRGVELFEVERGGDITFHGPGQAVVYPVMDLNNYGRDMHQYLRWLERAVIGTLQDFGLESGLKPGMTGVWINDRKVAAIGVAVSHWITYHGLALNVTTDLEYFKLINPCGITEFQVGSMEQFLNQKIDLAKVHDSLIINISKVFDCRIEKLPDWKIKFGL
jgi:lipoate-protein ligase B